MSLRQAAEMALAALVWEVGSCPEMYAKQTAEAITALRAALAEANEPVGCLHFSDDGEFIGAHHIKPPRREPLTEKQIGVVQRQLASTHAVNLTLGECRVVARAVERAHGIGTDE